MPSRRTSSSGQLPFNTFNAGPAYNDIGGPAPVLFSSTAALTTTAGPCAGPSIPVPHSGLCAPPVFSNFGATDIFTVDQHIRTPYIQNYNLNIQQQLASGVMLQIGYVGSAGRKLFRFRDLNQSVGGGPLPYPDFVYINQFESTAVSNYNGLQTSLRLRSHGLTSDVNYTWSHSIDNASDGQDFVPNASQPDNSFNTANERASSNFDTRQRLSWNFVYEFPSASHHKLLLSGWMLNGILSMQTGQPVNVNYLFEGDFNGSDEFFGRPDVVGDPKRRAYIFRMPFSTQLLLPSHAPGMRPRAPASPALSTSAISAEMHSPGLRSSSSISRWPRTPNHRSGPMQWRVDFFNIFNHPNFSNPLLPAFAVDFLNGSLRKQRPRHRLHPDHGDSGCRQRESVPRRRRSAQPSTRS